MCLLLLCGFCLVGSAAAQASDVQFRLGYADEVVVGTWNPLELQLQNMPAAELVLELEHGNASQGAVIYSYRAQLAGGPGLYLFTDDIYLPRWRHFSWRLRTPEQVLASGTLPRDKAQAAPLTLAVDAPLGSARRLLGEGRVVDVLASDLSERAAAYSGVDTVLIFPGAAPPATKALLAAASTGSHVVLLGSLPHSYQDLVNLTADGDLFLGAGSLSQLPTFNPKALKEKLLAVKTHTQRYQPSQLLAKLPPPEPPQHKPLSSWWLLLAMLGYLATTVVLLRRRSPAGLVSALVLAAAVGLSSARLRPESALTAKTSTLIVAANGLGLAESRTTLKSATLQQISEPLSAYPLDEKRRLSWQSTENSFATKVTPKRAVHLANKPYLSAPALSWQGGSLRNQSNEVVHDIYLKGAGQQGNLAEGSSLTPQNRNLVAYPGYAPVLGALPSGSVLARQGSNLLVVLPQRAGAQ